MKLTWIFFKKEKIYLGCFVSLQASLLPKKAIAVCEFPTLSVISQKLENNRQDS